MGYQPQDFTISAQVIALYDSWTHKQRIRYAKACHEGDHSVRDSMDSALTGGLYARNIKRADLCYIINHFDSPKESQHDQDRR